MRRPTSLAATLYTAPHEGQVLFTNVSREKGHGRSTTAPSRAKAAYGTGVMGRILNCASRGCKRRPSLERKPSHCQGWVNRDAKPPVATDGLLSFHQAH